LNARQLLLQQLLLLAGDKPAVVVANSPQRVEGLQARVCQQRRAVAIQRLRQNHQVLERPHQLRFQYRLDGQFDVVGAVGLDGNKGAVPVIQIGVEGDQVGQRVIHAARLRLPKPVLFQRGVERQDDRHTGDFAFGEQRLPVALRRFAAAIR